MMILFRADPFRAWRDWRHARPRLARPDALSDRGLRDIGLVRTHRPEGRIVQAH